MPKTLVKPRTKVRLKTQRPPLYKVILLNDDYTPREFVVLVLKAVFRMNEDQSYRVMMTAHQKGACVIAVYVRDVAETKAKEATEASAAGVGETCGGIANIPCDAGLWCEPPAGQCAGADIAAKCIRVPDICYQLMKPVCGATG